MAKVKTALRKLSVPEEVAFLRQLVTKMSGNPTFPTPAPTLAALSTAADDLQSAYSAAVAARMSSKLATSVMRDRQAAAGALIIQAAAYVQNVSNGDRTKIESAGFDVGNRPSPIGPLPAPESVELDANVNPGNMGLKWAGVTGAASYIVQRAPDADALDFVTVATTTAPRSVVNTMTSGTRYWFRIAAVGAAGPGEWTLPVSKIAP